MQMVILINKETEIRGGKQLVWGIKITTEIGGQVLLISEKDFFLDMQCGFNFQKFHYIQHMKITFQTSNYPPSSSPPTFF